MIGSHGWRVVDFARGWSFGLAGAAALLFLLNVAGAIAHRDQAKIRAHILQGFAGIETGQLSRDAVTDCVVLAGVVASPSPDLAYLLSQKTIVPNFRHKPICDNLHQMLDGDDTIVLTNYDRYWFGSIYQGAVWLYFFPLSTVQSIYKIMTILSILSLGLAGLRLKQQLRLPLMLVSLGIFAGAGIRSFWGNLGHAPVYFVGLFVIAGFLCLPSEPLSLKRAALFGAVIGTVAVYFDLLSGGIPFLLALSLFAYYLFWQQAARSNRGVLGLVAGIAGVLLAFCLSVVALVALKLFVVAALLGHPNALAVFKSQLVWRMSEDTIPSTGMAAIVYVLRALWQDRGMVFFGGRTGADVVFVIGAAGWLAAGVGAARNYRGSRNVADLLPVAVPLLAASVILAWFAAFQSHSVIHAWFMARILCLIPSFGLAAAAMVYAQSVTSRNARSLFLLGGSR